MLSQHRPSLLLLLVGLLLLEAYAVTHDTGYELWLLLVLLPVCLMTAVSFMPATKRVRVSYREWISQAFQLVLVVYLVLLLVQQFRSLALNLNYVLIAVLVLGALTVVFPAKHKEEKTRRTRRDTVLIWALGVLTAVLIFLKTGSLDWLRYVLSVFAGALVVLLGYLLYEEEKKETPLYVRADEKTGLLTLSVLFTLAALLTFWLGPGAFRIVFGSFFLLFLPGFILSYVFFSDREIDALERIALSFALSISVVPLLVFYLNLAGMRVSALSVAIVVLFICMSGFIAYKKKEAIKRYVTRRRRHSTK